MSKKYIYDKYQDDLTIEPNILKENGITFESFGILLYLNSTFTLPKKPILENHDIKVLWYKGFIGTTCKGNFKLNKIKFRKLLSDMKENVKIKKEKIADRAAALTPKLIELFPKGKKEGTNLYWKSSTLEVSNKLKKFLTHFGEEYTDDEIIKATQSYVDSFNGNYSYMRVLKYFIWKSVIKINEEGNYAEDVSDLAACLENAGQEEALRNDWISNMV